MAVTSSSSLWAQVRDYPQAFWFANFMEFIERWAYYGVRLTLALYIVGATALGGLEFTHIQKGNIYLWWAVIASFLPMFTGGFADRFGYKKTIGVAIALKIVGYLLMATQREYWPFFAGCMMLAAGTGLFKPGVQGLIAHSVSGKNASVGWGIFYELVNVGAFIAGFTVDPLKAWGGWTAIFAFNTALVALNFLPLLMFKEPDVNRPAPYQHASEVVAEMARIFVVSLRDILQPRLLAFIVIFSGFWFSFHQLFDLLPNFIDDWTTAASTPGIFQTRDGGVDSAQILNLNSGLIMVFMIPVAWIASRAKPLVAICIGIFASIVGILLAGASQLGTAVIAGVTVFTLGEMLSSPRTKDYMGTIAPPDKRALFMGYGEVPSGLGWALGSVFAGNFYEHHGDKVNFARAWLEKDGGMTAEAVKAIPKQDVMTTLATKANMTVPQATEMLWRLNHPETIWYWIAGVGVVSLVAMVGYTWFIGAMDRKAEMQAVVPGAVPMGDVPPPMGVVMESEGLVGDPTDQEQHTHG
ncbi:MAG: MFS transporter [Candidatus Sericytochromatia bacterium]|nr:MFS transporter [Candidatus Sericytochromatia bacterium]